MFSVVCYSPRIPHIVVAFLFAFPSKILLHMHITWPPLSRQALDLKFHSEAHTVVVVLRSRLHLIYINIIDIYLA